MMNRVVRDHGQHPLATLGTDAPSEVMRRHARQSVSGTWISPPFRGTALTYKVQIGKTFRPKQLPRHVLERQGDVLSHVPEDLDPRIFELGRRFAEGKSTTDEKVLAVLLHLSSGFTYSLEPLAGRSTESARALPLRSEAGALRAVRGRGGGAAPRRGREGPRRHGLLQRQLERPRRLPAVHPRRRPRVGRGAG